MMNSSVHTMSQTGEREGETEREGQRLPQRIDLQYLSSLQLEMPPSLHKLHQNHSIIFKFSRGIDCY